MLLDFFVEVPGRTTRRAPLGARPDPRLLHRRSPRRSSTSAPPRAGCPARRPGWPRRWGASARCRSRSSPASRPGSRATGVRGQRRAGVHLRDPRADPHPPARGPGDLRAGGPDPGRGRGVQVRGARRRARALRGGGPGALLPRARSPGVSEWVLERGGTLGADDLAAYRAERASPCRRGYRGAGRAHQPAALLRRHPDRLRPRAARPARARGRRRASWPRWRRPRLRAPRSSSTGCTRTVSRSGSSPRAARRGRRAGARRPASARPAGGAGTGRPARLDHAHHRRRRRGPLRGGHLLERHRLGRDRARAPGSTSTTCSARRT